MAVFLQRAWHCTVFTLDEETKVYENVCGRTLFSVFPVALEETVAHHLGRDHFLPREAFEVRAVELDERPPGLDDDELAAYDFNGFGEWTYVQSVIVAMRPIR